MGCKGQYVVAFAVMRQAVGRKPGNEAFHYNLDPVFVAMRTMNPFQRKCVHFSSGIAQANPAVAAFGNSGTRHAPGRSPSSMPRRRHAITAR